MTTRVLQYYEPLHHPSSPSLSLTGLRLVVRMTTCWGFPCCCCIHLSCMLSPILRQNHWLRSSFTSPMAAGFPILITLGRLPHHPFRSLLSVHSHYGLHDRQVPKEPSTPEASAHSLPPRLLQLLPARTKVAGWDSHPLEYNAFPRRTLKMG